MTPGARPRRLLVTIVRAGEGVAKLGARVQRWWRRRWIVVVATPLGLWCLVVFALTWKYIGERVASISEVFAQMQMLITTTQALIGFVVGVAVMHSARAAAESTRQAAARALREAHSERVGRALAFVGAASDASVHAGMLAMLQRTGLKKRLPSPRAEEELRLVTWQSLTAAVSASAKALQHLRYSDDDILEPATALFAVVQEVVQDAAAGRSGAIEEKADLIGRRSIEIEEMVTDRDPRTLQCGAY